MAAALARISASKLRPHPPRRPSTATTLTNRTARLPCNVAHSYGTSIVVTPAPRYRSTLLTAAELSEQSMCLKSTTDPVQMAKRAAGIELAVTRDGSFQLTAELNEQRL